MKYYSQPHCPHLEEDNPKRWYIRFNEQYDSPTRQFCFDRVQIIQFLSSGWETEIENISDHSWQGPAIDAHLAELERQETANRRDPDSFMDHMIKEWDEEQAARTPEEIEEQRLWKIEYDKQCAASDLAFKQSAKYPMHVMNSDALAILDNANEAVADLARSLTDDEFDAMLAPWRVDWWENKYTADGEPVKNMMDFFINDGAGDADAYSAYIKAEWLDLKSMTFEEQLEALKDYHQKYAMRTRVYVRGREVKS